ncbi:hypothetical protein FACS1894103_4890 [Campylobacterota bacterium]|nr:hypothetical protein FACS1894103_4890 [Campylobacterota bacterium]
MTTREKIVLFERACRWGGIFVMAVFAAIGAVVGHTIENFRLSDQLALKTVGIFAAATILFCAGQVSVKNPRLSRWCLRVGAFVLVLFSVVGWCAIFLRVAVDPRPFALLLPLSLAVLPVLLFLIAARLRKRLITEA